MVTGSHGRSNKGMHNAWGNYSGNSVCNKSKWGEKRGSPVKLLQIVRLKNGNENLNKVNSSTNTVMKLAILNLGIPPKNSDKKL